MKRSILVLGLIISIVIANTAFAFALQQGEIIPNDISMSYGVQTLNGNFIALNIGGEVGLSRNFGLEGIVTYYEEDDFEENVVVDLNTKWGIVKEPDFNVAAIFGYHTRVKEDSQGHPRVGVIASKSETADLDLNVGLDFLLKKNEDLLGYMLGFDYMMTEDVYLEIEHRRFAGQAKTEGLNVGMRYYF